ncbi:MAG TPA: hypothetical protein VHA14_04135, partial [Bryobacteraceae bacterium]|nr:hypothetical protein [Bryobacteraceae bacterium]
MNLTKKNVLICDNQPVAVEGIRWLLENTEDLHFGGTVATPEAIYALLQSASPAGPAANEMAVEGEPIPIAEVLDPDLANLMGAVAGDSSRPAPDETVALFPAEL